MYYRRSQWPRGCRSTAARPLRLWVRIPPRAWIFVCCECCVLSGRGLWRVVVCDQETSRKSYGAVENTTKRVVTPRKQTNNKHIRFITQYFSNEQQVPSVLLHLFANAYCDFFVTGSRMLQRRCLLTTLKSRLIRIRPLVKQQLQF